MTGAQFTEHMNQLGILAALIAELPLAELRAIPDEVDTVMPILDPTRYRDGMHRLDDQRELLDAALHVQRAVNAIKTRHLEGLARREEARR